MRRAVDRDEYPVKHSASLCPGCCLCHRRRGQRWIGAAVAADDSGHHLSVIASASEPADTIGYPPLRLAIRAGSGRTQPHHGRPTRAPTPATGPVALTAPKSRSVAMRIALTVGRRGGRHDGHRAPRLGFDFLDEPRRQGCPLSVGLHRAAASEPISSRIPVRQRIGQSHRFESPVPPGSRASLATRPARAGPKGLASRRDPCPGT